MTSIKTGMALAAGLGTRMRPLTLSRPKALVEVGGKALLDHVLDRFAASGIETAVVNIHHFADQIRAHVAARSGAPDIIISDESDRVLETGGGLVKAREWLGGDPVIVSNIDAIWTEVAGNELDRLMTAFDDDRMDALLLLAPKENTLGYEGAGDFFLEPDGQVRRRGGAKSAPFVYAGTQILDPRVLQDYEEAPFSLNVVWNDLLARGRVYGQPMSAFWMHVGDPEAREAAERRLG